MPDGAVLGYGGSGISECLSPMCCAHWIARSRIDVGAGALTMSSGAILTANGQAGYTVGTYTGGAGAGGSIWVSAADVSGTGTMSANGGARSGGYAAGGGAYRVV